MSRCSPTGGARRSSPPPSVEATSSASFRVRWKASSCRPALTWELLYSSVENHNSNQWQVLETDIAGSEYDVQSLRCVAGCAFRLRPHRLDGLDDAYSLPSAVVKSAALHSPPEGSVRIELQLAAGASAEGEGPLSGLVGRGCERHRHRRLALRRGRGPGAPAIRGARRAQGGVARPHGARAATRQGRPVRGGAACRRRAPVLLIHLDGTTAVLEAPRGLGGGAYLVGASLVAAVIFAVLRALGSRGTAAPMPPMRSTKFAKVHGLSDVPEEEEASDDDDFDGSILRRGA